ncbi:hypothetical protein Cdeb_01594 [Caldibacillus debilis GB1]|uniref:Uncharacterized protein n=1 Tax=Caldibacillus debilis GB1 TaxID=1339248 RepID=A0A420VCH4_9BACI|nr:hypothetical protein Cdeb_01594 [Caldibacillus debilis GB1]
MDQTKRGRSRSFPRKSPPASGLPPSDFPRCERKLPFGFAEGKMRPEAALDAEGNHPFFLKKDFKDPSKSLKKRMESSPLIVNTLAILPSKASVPIKIKIMPM